MDNEFIAIVDELQKSGNDKVLELLRRMKISQDDLIKETVSIVEETDDGIYYIDPKRLRQNIIDNLGELSAEQVDFVAGVLDEAYKAAYSNTAAALGMAVDWHILRQEFIDRAVNAPIEGANFSDRIWKNTNNLANRIYNDVLNIIQTGKRPDQVAREIRRDYGVTAYQAKRLVHTELARVVNDAQIETYKNSGVVEKVIYMATLEDSTCEICGELDGQEFDLDKAPKIPQHPNCRCCLIPKTKNYTIRQRADNTQKKTASSNARQDIIDYVTYSEWSNGR